MPAAIVLRKVCNCGFPTYEQADKQLRRFGGRTTSNRLHGCPLEVVSSAHLEPMSLSHQDNDNRVREASHQALKSCAKTVKNALGPHLRSIIGCWVSGMCDPHGPAASAAQNAFASTFPLDKQREVFKFGLRAIFAVSLIPSTS